MQSTRRTIYLSYLIIGIIFIFVGFALDELEILIEVNNYLSNNNFDGWYDFLLPWIGNSDGGGLPVPWGQ